MRELTDERLQDYVDGRLSEAERAEVEALLRADPEQARRVEAWQSIGNSLREEEAELSPGFYARARERFEESRRPRGLKLLSWETAGLAAAAVLAVAIFVPGLMRGPELAPASAVGRPQQAQAEELRADSPAPVEGKLQAEPPEVVAEMEQAPQAAGERAGRFAPVPPGKGDAEAPVEQIRRTARARALPADDALADRDEAVFSEATAAAPMAKKMEVPAALPLGAETAPPRGIRVATRDERNGLLGKNDADDRRLVLVGYPGADCTSLAYRVDAGSYRVTLSAGGNAAGCAFLLPDDGLPVILDE